MHRQQPVIFADSVDEASADAQEDFDEEEERKKEVRNEKAWCNKCDALTPIKRSDLPPGTKLLTTTWAMKKKSNGKFHGRLNLRGFQQVAGQHCATDSVSAPVINPHSVRISLTPLAMNPKWTAWVEDVKGAFLQGKFAKGEEMCIQVSEGF